MAPKTFFDAIYVYAWFTGFLISGALYLLGMRLRAAGTVGATAPALD
jgi:cytosine/uracil/thiamine/allantoin permease